MNPEVKVEWIRRLRSGEYPQARGALNRVKGNDVGFCCLGVLSEVAVDAGVAIREFDEYPNMAVYVDLQNGDSSAFGATTGIQEWAGLVVEDVDKLISLNDGQGESFAEIADYVEGNL